MPTGLLTPVTIVFDATRGGGSVADALVVGLFGFISLTLIAVSGSDPECVTMLFRVVRQRCQEPSAKSTDSYNRLTSM